MSNDNKNNNCDVPKSDAGTKGNDTVIGTSRNDVLDGRQGSDTVIGNSGNDTLIYRMSENAGAKDVYDGGRGTDTLRLEFTKAEWLQASVQTDVARFLDSLDDCRNGRWFEFKAFNLKVTDLENLEIWVDGVRLDARNQSVDAVNDKASVAEGGTVTGNVLANDSVPDLVKVVALVDGPDHGTLTLDLKGNFSFVAGAYFDSLGAGQTATETFKYRVTDADGDSDTAIVTITITGTNDGPVAKADAYAAGEDTILTVSASKGVLANDSDVDNCDVLKVSTTGTITSQMGATVKLNADGSFSYDARSAAALQALNDGQTAVDSFNYTVSDGNGGSATATVKVTVTGSSDNHAPVARADSYAAGEDAVLTVAAKGVLANDTDADAGDVLKVSSTGTITSASGASVTLNADGSFSYDARSAAALQALGTGKTAADSFNYTVSDGHGGSATATVTVTVTGANDGPVAKADAYATGEDTVLTVAAKGVLANDSDIDVGDVLKVSTTGTITSQMGATVKLNADGSFSYDARSAAALQALNDGQTAVDSFNYTVSDGNGGSATATVKVTVTGSSDNHAPVARADSYAAGEDIVLTVPAKGVLANDTDIDAGDVLTVSSTGTITSASGANVTLNADGSFNYDARSAAALQALGAGKTAADSFNYTVSDGHGGSATATVTVTVTGANDGPLARADAYATGEDAVLTVAAKGVLANDTDIDAGDVLTVSSTGTITSQMGASVTLNADGSFSYDARSAAALQALNDGQSAVDSFNYTVSDGHGGSAMATVKVTVAGANDNQAPIAADDDLTTSQEPFPGKNPVPVELGNVLGNDSDPDGNALVVTPVSYALANDWLLTIDATGAAQLSSTALKPKGGSILQPLGEGESITLTTDVNGNALTYHVSDGQLSDTAQVTLTLLGSNDDPEAFGAAATIDEGTGYTFTLDELGFDPDAHDTLDWSFGAGANGQVEINLDGSITYTPDQYFYGTDSFSYTLTDQHGASVTGMVDITVNPVNDAPVAMDDDFVADEDSAITKPKAGASLALGNVLDNDSDVEADALSVAPVSYALDNGWRLEIDENGNAALVVPIKKGMDLNALGEGESVSISHDIHGNALSYTLSDGTVTDTANVTVTVLGRNDAPEAFGYAFATDEDSSYTFLQDDLGWDPDNNDTLSWNYTVAEHGQITFNADGSVTYTPDADYSGLDSFSYTLIDRLGEVSTGMIDITVNPVNDAPDAVDDEFLAYEDAAIVKPKGEVTLAFGNVLDNDSDIEGDGLTVNAVTYTLDNGWRLEIDEAGHAQLVVGGKKGMDLNSLGEGEWISFSADSHGNALTYTLSDGVLTDTANLAVTVLGNNDAPEAFGASRTIEENSSVTLSTDELGWDPDRNDSLSWAYGAAANGAIVDNGDGTLTYTPNEDYEGEDSFSYTVTDSLGVSASGTVSITLTPSTNSAPLAGDPLPHLYLTTADGSAAFDLPANAFTDPDGDTLTYSIGMANGDPNGALWIDPQTGLIEAYGQDAIPGRWDVRLTATDPHGATASDEFSIFVLSPSAEWQGSAGDDFFGVSYVSNALLEAGAGNDTLFVENSGGFINGGDGNDTIFLRGAAPWLTVDAGAGEDRVTLIFENTKMDVSVGLGNDADRDTIAWFPTGPWPDGAEVVEVSNFRLGPEGDLLDLRGLMMPIDASSDIEDFISLSVIDYTSPPGQGPQFQADLAFSVDLDGPGSDYAFQQFAILRDVVVYQPNFSNEYVDHMVPYNLAV